MADVAVGQQAKIYINAYPDEVFGGTVRQIALQRAGSPDGTGFFVTEVEIDLQGRRIYSGLVANVDLEIETHEGVLVPQQAIVARDVDDLPEEVRENPLLDQTKQKVNVLYRLVEGKAVCTPIKPGASDLTHRLILAGLEEGDEVITGPLKVLSELNHDDRVKPAVKSQTDEPPDPADATATREDGGDGG